VFTQHGQLRRLAPGQLWRDIATTMKRDAKIKYHLRTTFSLGAALLAMAGSVSAGFYGEGENASYGTIRHH
jgi:hypothetical protein